MDRHGQDPGHRLDRSFLHPTWLCCPQGRTDFQRHWWSSNNIIAHGSDACYLLLYNKNILELCFENWVATGGGRGAEEDYLRNTKLTKTKVQDPVVFSLKLWWVLFIPSHMMRLFAACFLSEHHTKDCPAKSDLLVFSSYDTLQNISHYPSYLFCSTSPIKLEVELQL